MNIFFKPSLIFLFCIFSSAYANDLSLNLQKTCTSEQVNHHKSIKEQKLESSDFEDYCKCESKFVIDNATKDQLSQIPDMKNKNPNWLRRLKSDALKSCLEQKRQTTTKYNIKSSTYL
jgi:hypothetical protein